MTWGRRKTEPDVPRRYTYANNYDRPEHNPNPGGVECAERAGDPHRALGTACNRCGHVVCQAWVPCDICRVTIRIRALEEPS